MQRPLVSLFCLLLILLFPVPCLAWTHGQFTATTDACGGCHVAHAGRAAKLLKVSPPEATLCFFCHGAGAPGAPYDVEDGYTVGAAVYPSTAGGFVYQFRDLNANYAIDPGELVPVTSRHNVWGIVGESGPLGLDPAAVTLAIPGGSNAFTGTGFTCTSCHDPHAGGKVPDVNGLITGNPRLLKTVLFGKTVNWVSVQVQSVGTFAYSATPSGVYTVVGYAYGFTDWCGACHDHFPDWVLDGHASLVGGFYRHPTVAHIITAPKDPSITTGTPVENWNLVNKVMRRVTCISCHRAHSTAATMSGWALTWPREDGTTGTTSALLRMDNRGICWNCHDAALYNDWNDKIIGTSSCSVCHPQ